jgi:hypothetical protein
MAERTPRRPSPFRQRDVTAAILAAEKAGKEVVGVRFGKDGFELITSPKTEREGEGISEWRARIEALS